jgi:hypothetical protein
MIKLFAQIALLIFISYATYYLYLGISNPVPALGDSWDYHIPISQSILNGSFIIPHAKIPQQYYPGSSEAINSLFMLLHIPLTISNLIAIIILGFTCWKLALTFRLSFYYALFFALTIVTLNGIVRWFNAVSIDIWVAVFFCLGIILLEKPQKTFRYFFCLGATFGMLLGSKYMAILYVILLSSIYAKKLLPFITIARFFVFLIPVSILGLFWYIRNGILLGNPLYPLCILNLPCQEIFTTTVLSVGVAYPIEMFNAIFGEFKLWIVAPLVIIFYFVKKIWTKSRTALPYGVTLLSIVGGVLLVAYLFYPTSKQPWIMVSSLRYSYPAIIPLILVVFLIAKQFKKETLLCYFGIANMLSVLSMTYYPKLILISLPITGLSIYFLKKWEK